VVLTGDPTTDLGSRPPRPTRPADPDRAPSRGPARRIAVLVIATALGLALVRSLLVQSFVVPTGSMDPTVHPGDRVLVSRLSYLTGDVKRGDVIVFDGSGVFEPDSVPARSPLASAGRTVAAAFGLPIGSRDYLKRVIGLPGERVVCCDAQGRITIDGKPLDEPYLAPGQVPSTIRFDIIVPPDRLWVLGDHRSDSADSRAHLGDPGGGTVPVNRVVGRATRVYWPFSHLGGISSSAPAESAPAGSASTRGVQR